MKETTRRVLEVDVTSRNSGVGRSTFFVMWCLRTAVFSGVVLLTSACGSSWRDKTITYEVSGQETAEVAYVNSEAELIKGQVVPLPWTMTVKVRPGSYVSVLTNGAGDGALVCTVKINGVQVVTKSSDDVPVIRCDATVE